MLTDSKLKSQIDALWNRFWSSGISNPLTAIEQMSYFIFQKRLVFLPLSLQQQFAGIVVQAETFQKKQKESESELENLFLSLL